MADPVRVFHAEPVVVRTVEYNASAKLERASRRTSDSSASLLPTMLHQLPASQISASAYSRSIGDSTAHSSSNSILAIDNSALSDSGGKKARAVTFNPEVEIIQVKSEPSTSLRSGDTGARSREISSSESSESDSESHNDKSLSSHSISRLLDTSLPNRRNDESNRDGLSAGKYRFVNDRLTGSRSDSSDSSRSKSRKADETRSLNLSKTKTGSDLSSIGKRARSIDEIAEGIKRDRMSRESRSHTTSSRTSRSYSSSSFSSSAHSSSSSVSRRSHSRNGRTREKRSSDCKGGHCEIEIINESSPEPVASKSIVTKMAKNLALAAAGGLLTAGGIYAYNRLSGSATNSEEVTLGTVTM